MPYTIRNHEPIASLRLEASRLRRLADDLDTLATGKRPAARALSSAPIIEDWKLAPRPVSCLTGIVFGHPRIDDGRPALTTELWVVDEAFGYARTLSRFYRLGRPGLVDIL